MTQHTFILTGCAGFIGSFTAKKLLDMGHRVIGIDNLNDYYDPNLKRARLDFLIPYENFSFHKENIEDIQAMNKIFQAHPQTDYVIHLAAQAGVRYSLENPYSYITSNVMGHTVLIEAARQLKNLKHFVYASSSSVYGDNKKIPFSIDDRVDTPMSLYAATKKSCEMISYCYASLYKIPQTGLRFFTVYGPYGRPDMAAFIFADAISQNKPIKLFNYGDMQRDFTYVDDIVEGILGATFKSKALSNTLEVPHMAYNLGNHKSERLIDFVGILEQEFGKKAIIDKQPIQPGDVPATFADIDASQKDFGFTPKTNIQQGLKNFVSWYKDHYYIDA